MSGGWIKHTGNTCPVDGRTPVRVEYRGLSNFIRSDVYLAARFFNWVVAGNAPSDIVRYETRRP
jgi:hypothetical protein